MEELLSVILEIILESKLLLSMIIIVIAYFLYRLLRAIFDKGSKSKRINRRRITYVKLFGSCLKYFFLILTILIILKVNGFNVNSLLTGLGIVGIIVGLAIQDLIKDIIGGFNIIAENFFSVGDVIRYNGMEGKVISVGIKNTKIQDISTNDIYVISNGNIQEIINLSDYTLLEIPIPYTEKHEKVNELFNRMAEVIKTFDNVIDCENYGICGFEESYVSYKLKIQCHPTKKIKVKRMALVAIKTGLDDYNIHIPYRQLDVHIKNS